MSLQLTMFLRAYHCASIPWLQHVVQVMLFPMIKVLCSYINTFWSMRPVPNVPAFCSTLMSYAFHVCCSDILWIILRWFQLPILLLVSRLFVIPHKLYFYLKSSQPLSWLHFCPLTLCCVVSIHVPFSLLWIVISSLLLGMALSFFTCWFHYMVTLLS
jgi:hypothetical protein